MIKGRPQALGLEAKRMLQAMKKRNNGMILKRLTAVARSDENWCCVSKIEEEVERVTEASNNMLDDS